MYTEQERAIYKYHNGSKQVCADPMVLWRKIQTCYPPESTFQHDMKLVDIQNEESIPAFERIINMVRAVFKLPALDEDGNGVTDREAFMTLTDFSLWMEEMKERFFQQPNSQTCTAQESSPSGASQSATKSSSDSGSTVTV